jgi:trehalose synthase
MQRMSVRDARPHERGVQLAAVSVPVLPTERFKTVLPGDAYQRFEDGAARAREVLSGRIVWNVNSTAQGGGVAEMLHSLIAYARGAGIDARWMVIEGDPDFFALTKRIHNRLHGYPGDGGNLGPEERRVYQRVSDANAESLVSLIRPQDLVILHDPQTAGLCGPVAAAGATAIWRCHVGVDRPNHLVSEAWDFLRECVDPARSYVFSRAAYAWAGLPSERVTVIPPSIDAFSAKNQELSDRQVASILGTAGILAERRDAGEPTFLREDGSPGTVVRVAEFSDEGPPPPADARLVVQVSRWDRLKDPVGVLVGYAEHVAPRSDAHLVLAGPAVEAVSDDPEGLIVLGETLQAWEAQPPAVRSRIHLACLPMQDGEENAAMVNAIQRRADVVVQKSLAEGFGLTVAEAMWKARPVVATRVGGIQDQIVHGESGLLIDQPKDLQAFGDAVRTLLDDPGQAARLGEAARARARSEYLGARHLLQDLDLFARLLES